MASIPVETVDDFAFERDEESFTLLVVAFEGSISITQSSTIVMIKDNDRMCA